MALKFFNTLTRSVQDFVPLDTAGRKVGMYCCGPTVYDLAHIGNFRTFLFADLVRRYLEFKGYTVAHVMNITDVEDKIIKRVRETGKSLRDFTAEYENAFLEDFQALGCKAPHHLPRATEHISEIIGLIEKLMARGLAYQAADGSVYFSIEKYRGCGCRYGQLVNLNPDQLRPGERVSSDEYDKESVADFALWKARSPEDGSVFWPSPWGEGRPGWHIECSAMSMKWLGPSFDLHLGGEDLIFPHHEDEIAQSEGAALQNGGQRFVKYWLHGAFLLVEGRKMSKSSRNFFTLRDLLAKGFAGRVIRYLMLTAHYRETFNFTLEGLQGARAALARLDECLNKLRELAALENPRSDGSASGPPEGGTPNKTSGPPEGGTPNKTSGPPEGGTPNKTSGPPEGGTPNKTSGPPEGGTPNKTSGPPEGGTPDLLAGVESALDDDLNVSAAWGGIFEWVRETNRALTADELSPVRAAAALAAWQRIDSVFGVGVPTEAEAPAEILALLEQRQAARQARDFKRADAIRDELKAKGWLIEDTPKGPRLKKG